MKKIALCFLGMLLSLPFAGAEQIKVAENNFVITVPDDWKQIPPPAEIFSAAAQGPNEGPILLIATTKLKEGDRATGAAEMMKGIAKSVVSGGFQTSEPEVEKVGEFPFVKLTAKNEEQGTSLAAYTLVAGEVAYAIQFVGKTEAGIPSPTTDKILQSFELLFPAEVPAVESGQQSEAYKIGYQMGRWAATLFIPVMVVLLILAGGGVGLYFWLKSRKRSRGYRYR